MTYLILGCGAGTDCSAISPAEAAAALGSDEGRAEVEAVGSDAMALEAFRCLSDESKGKEQNTTARVHRQSLDHPRRLSRTFEHVWPDC